MPFRGIHNHFANNKQSPERERRLLGFADESEKKEEAEKVPDDMKKRKRFEDYGKKLKVTVPQEGLIEFMDGMTHSRAMVRETIHALSLEDRFAPCAELLEEPAFINSPSDLQIAEYLVLNPDSEWGKRFRKEVIEILEEPTQAITLAWKLKNRIEDRDGLTKFVAKKIGLLPGEVTLRRLERLEQKCEIEGGESLDVWLQKQDVDAICHELGINRDLSEILQAPPTDAESKEMQEALQSIAMERFADGKATKENVLHRVRVLHTSALKLRNMEENDKGETVQELTEHEKKLHAYLDAQIQIHAIEVHSFITSELNTLMKPAMVDGKLVPAAFKSKHGVPFVTVMAHLADTSDTLLYITQDADNSSDIAELRKLGLSIPTEEIKKPPQPADPGFLQYAEDALDTVNTEQARKEKIVEEAVREAKDAYEKSVRWLEGEEGRLRQAERLMEAGLLSPERAKELCILPVETRKHVRAGFGTNADFQRAVSCGLSLALTPEIERQLSELDSQRSRMSTEPESENTETNRRMLSQEIDKYEKDLIENPLISEHVIGSTFDLKDEIAKRCQELRDNLHIAGVSEGSEKGNELMLNVRNEVARLKRCSEKLAGEQLELSKEGEFIGKIKDLEGWQYEMTIGKGSKAFYDHDENMIYINKTKAPTKEEQRKLLYHEQAHRVLHILTRKEDTKLFPVMLESIAQGMDIGTVEREGKPASYMHLLEQLAERWGVAKMYDRLLEQELERLGKEDLAEASAKNLYRGFLVDELLAKHASWKMGHRKSQTEEELILFRWIDDYGLEEEKADHAAMVNKARARAEEKREERRRIGLHATDVGDDEDIPAVTEDSEEATTISMYEDPQVMFTEINRKLYLLETFLDTSPEYSNELYPEVQLARSKYSEYLEMFGSTEDVEAELKLLTKFVDYLLDITKELDEAEFEQNTRGKKRFSITDYVTFLSIIDIVQMTKNMGEDIARMWKRRGERAQNQFGEWLTGKIPKWVPYLGRLRHEFHRRGLASELDEVKQWKESFEQADDWALEDMIPKARNPDMLRAILELLSERGRIDWNNEKLWHTLNRFSRFKMPIAACRRSTLTRDGYLQRLITNIWNDKNHWKNWRRANDSGLEEGKRKFIGQAEQLSSIDGGLAGKLERILRGYVNAKEKGVTPPEEVDPHYFEEVLHFAMRNGKMTMQEKLFYLVQGVRYGLIPFERVGYYTGEQGGILNRFPMIDYFTGKHNTYYEMMRLGSRLEESGAGRFKPGSQTSFWLQYEVLKDKDSDSRIKKATSGMNAENIDHEDYPAIFSTLDYAGIDRLTGVISGSREKLSPEAVRNSYVSQGTVFKMAARKIQLERDGVPGIRFTKDDAKNVARLLAAYIHMDNIFTRNGYDKPDDNARPKLTPDEIRTTPGPSTGGRTIGEIRNVNNKFAQEVLKGFGDSITYDAGVTRESYIRAPNDFDERRKGDREKNFAFTKRLHEQLVETVTEDDNFEKLKDLLVEFADHFVAEHDFKYKKEELRNYIQLKQAA